MWNKSTSNMSGVRKDGMRGMGCGENSVRSDE
jgi:hypothetical protein